MKAIVNPSLMHYVGASAFALCALQQRDSSTALIWGSLAAADLALAVLFSRRQSRAEAAEQEAATRAMIAG
ncbi:hypothetical protein [Pelomonas sp. SE-A7]|uniref:hypothetical protein n=1 Tax=Pelomonas sp. SE-A7 TaxID=3054953 RepID=UPI00259CBBA6|nr:hypothetical protein [Pelomonas sp. SE-A7]MDM4765661.1 hypothetical protein [Pelomonas sp. SE-A7]